MHRALCKCRFPSLQDTEEGLSLCYLEPSLMHRVLVGMHRYSLIAPKQLSLGATSTEGGQELVDK